MEKNHVKLVYLIGSYARDTAREDSDVDVAVLFMDNVSSSDILTQYSELIALFEEILEISDNIINIIDLQNIDIIFKMNVLLDGILLYKKDNISRADFQEATIREYLDFKPFVDVQKKYLKVRALAS